jgi:two-component system response regulator YesN
MIATVATLVVASSVLYAGFEQVARTLLYSFSERNLTQIAHSVDFMTSTAKSLATQIYYDPVVADILLLPPQSDREAGALRQLDNYRYVNASFVNSIYVYSRKSDRFYLSLPSSSSYVQAADSFYDQGIVSILRNITSYRRFAVIPRRVPMPVPARNAVREVFAYTFVYYETVTLDRPGGAVVLTISEEWMRDIMRSLNSDPTHGAIIIDEDGVTLTSSALAGTLTDISGQDYVRRVLASKTPQATSWRQFRGRNPSSRT